MDIAGGGAPPRDHEGLTPVGGPTGWARRVIRRIAAPVASSTTPIDLAGGGGGAPLDEILSD